MRKKTLNEKELICANELWAGLLKSYNLLGDSESLANVLIIILSNFILNMPKDYRDQFARDFHASIIATIEQHKGRDDEE
jgi:hypothetical protein